GGRWGHGVVLQPFAYEIPGDANAPAAGEDAFGIVVRVVAGAVGIHEPDALAAAGDVLQRPARLFDVDGSAVGTGAAAVSRHEFHRQREPVAQLGVVPELQPL